MFQIPSLYSFGDKSELFLGMGVYVGHDDLPRVILLSKHGDELSQIYLF